MKKIILNMLLCTAIAGTLNAQDIKSNQVPSIVKEALMKKYPKATKVTWEKEKGNYEANWGGKSGEDMSMQFTPAGAFVEQVVAISPAQLPAGVAAYVQKHYPGIKIKEAGLVTDAKGVTTYEAEIKGKDLIFDKNGNYLKQD
ncbi:MAG: PepSY-like domain-containing protein [Bacteroidetes bacterium]|nr:PepSY-like domain-containing protein [Bacteroidota bacterium]